jgi:hypothetical protein
MKTLEEAACKALGYDYNDWVSLFSKDKSTVIYSEVTNWCKGAKWQAERMYSYDELRAIAYNAYCKGQLDNPTEGEFNLWIQQFKKK